MQPANFPTQIDLLRHAELGFKWRGVVDLNRFVRIFSEATDRASTAEIELPQSSLTVDYSLFQTDQKLPWVIASAQGQMPTVCQRCLTAMTIDIDVSIDFAVLTEELFVERLGTSEEYVVLGDEHIVKKEGRQIDVDLLAILEDEIMLDIPLAPRHDNCDPLAPHLMVDSIDHLSDEETQAPKTNPFSALAELKEKK